MQYSKRIRILREGVRTTDGRVLEDLEWPVLGMRPVMIADGRLIGHLSEYEKFDDGWWTALLTVVEDVQVTGLAAEADVDLTTGRLLGVVLGESPAWNDMWID